MLRKVIVIQKGDFFKEIQISEHIMYMLSAMYYK